MSDPNAPVASMKALASARSPSLSDDVLHRKLTSHTALPASISAHLANLAQGVKTYKAGALIAVSGDPLDQATLMVEGLACRSRVLADGRRQILSLVVPGDIIDAHASLLDRRHDNIEALSACRIARTPQSQLAAVSLAYPLLGEALQREALIEGAISREWVANVGRRSTLEALAHLICEMALRMDAVGLVQKGAFPFELTQQDLADALGVTAIYLNRMLKRLRHTGMIAVRGRTLEVLEWDTLRRLADFNPGYLHLEQAAA